MHRSPGEPWPRSSTGRWRGDADRVSALAGLVATSSQVAASSARSVKIQALAAYVAALDPADVADAVAFLSGVVPHGPLGVGWATLAERPDPSPASSLTIGEVSDIFDRLSALSGPGSTRERRREVDDLLGRATADEQDFLVALMMGEIRQGALEGLMVDAVARAASVPVATVRRAAMLDGRLWAVAAAAREGAAALDAVGLTLFRPVKPMLAQSAHDVSAALERTGPARVDWKLDGIRIQVHRRAGDVEVYTRNLNRVTDRLGGVVDAVLAMDVDTVVLDGEALFLDEESRPARFQDTAGRFSTEELDERGIRAFYFDLLHLDGDDLIDTPTSQRRRLLEEVAEGSTVPGREATDSEDAAAVMAEALAAGHEGVVVKAADAPYEAGRRGAGWIKVKPVHTLDLVVLGAEWGHGRRQGYLSNLHLGARHGDEFVMLGKTFKGLTDEILEWQTRRLQELETRRNGHVVYVRPELVVEIALDGVQVSTRYPGGVALRFARVRGYRPDKDPAEADTLDTVRAMGGLGPGG